MLLKIGSYVHGSRPDFTALEVKYYKACYKTYLNKVCLSSAGKNSQLKKKASVALLKHVDKFVIKQNVPVLVYIISAKNILRFLLLYGGDITVLKGYMVQNMCRKLNKHMGNVITVTSIRRKLALLFTKLTQCLFFF